MDAVIYEGSEQQIEPPRKDKVWEEIQTLKNNRSPGEDNINAELTRYRHQKLRKEIRALKKVIWASEKMP
jgi:hypothetical protein